VNLPANAAGNDGGARAATPLEPCFDLLVIVPFAFVADLTD